MSRERVLQLVDELCEVIPEAKWEYYSEYHGRCKKHDDPLLPLIGCPGCNDEEKELEEKFKELKKLIKDCRKGY